MTPEKGAVKRVSATSFRALANRAAATSRMPSADRTRPGRYRRSSGSFTA